MRIAIDCRFIGKSGIGTFVENVVDCMLRMHPGHEYLLIVNKDTKRDVFDGYYQVLKTDIAPFSVKELLRFPVEHINKCDAYYTPYINIPMGVKIPVYSTIHDMLFFDVDGLVSPLGKQMRRLYYKRAIGCSKKIFTVSEFSKEHMLQHFPTDKEITVVYNGVSRNVRNYDICDVKKNDYLLYVGNIKKHKGLKTLVEAYCLAQEKGLNTKLLIVGNKEKFRTADTDLFGLVEANSNIMFTGWVPDDELVKLLAEAKCLIQPSLYEGFGIPPLEALYLGTNVILTDIPVFKEVYSELPVTFFKVNDVEMLSELLLRKENPDFELDSVRNMIDSRYNYAEAARVILNSITK